VYPDAEIAHASRPRLHRFFVGLDGRSRTYGGEDLRQAVDEVKMALSGVEGGLTPGDD
jgi:hypothetical protein